MASQRGQKPSQAGGEQTPGTFRPDHHTGLFAQVPSLMLLIKRLKYHSGSRHDQLSKMSKWTSEKKPEMQLIKWIP